MLQCGITPTFEFRYLVGNHATDAIKAEMACLTWNSES